MDMESMETISHAGQFTSQRNNTTLLLTQTNILHSTILNKFFEVLKDFEFDVVKSESHYKISLPILLLFCQIGQLQDSKFEI